MTLKDQLKFCSECQNKKFDPNRGIVCGLTDNKPDFVDYCASFDGDIAKVKLKQEQAVEEISNEALLETLPHEAKDKLRKYQSFGFAIFGGSLVAILAAIVWAALTVATKYQTSWAAIGIGLAVGFSIQFFGAGIDRKFGVLGAILAILACMLGNVLSILGLAAIEEQVAFLDMLSFLSPLVSIYLIINSFEPIDLVFYGLAGFEGYHFAFRKMPKNLSQPKAFVPAMQILRQPLALTSAVAIGFVLIFVSLNSSQEKISYYESGDISSKGKYIHGLAEGPWEYYYDEGGLLSKGSYVNGKEEGQWTYYRVDSFITMTKEFHRGIEHGEFIEYGDEGEIFQRGEYAYGRQNGRWTVYFENQDVMSKGFFQADKQVGKWIFYHENGAVKGSGLYEDGSKIGRWKLYDEEGLLTEETIHYQDPFEVEYVNVLDANKKPMIVDGNGILKLYHDNGKLALTGRVKDKKREGDWTYFNQKGRKFLVERYSEGIGSVHEIYDQNNYPLVHNGSGDFVGYFASGLVELEGKYLKGQKEGSWVLYFDKNGKKISETENYVNGLLEGNCVSYFEDGSIYIEGAFVAGKRHGDWKWYKQDGSLDSEVSFVEGKKQGDQPFYDMFGNVFKVETYDKDKLKETRLF